MFIHVKSDKDSLPFEEQITAQYKQLGCYRINRFVNKSNDYDQMTTLKTDQKNHMNNKYF